MTKNHQIILDFIRENFEVDTEEFILIFQSSDEAILIDKNKDKMRFRTNDFGQIFFGEVKE